MTSSAVDLTKVSTYLREKMDEEPTAKHPVSIWLTSPDISAQQTTLQTAVASIQENADVELASTGVSRQVALDNVKANYRASVTQIYSTNNNDFVSSCIDEDDIVFVSRYAPMIIANLTNEEIRNLSRSSEVISMDYHVEPEFEASDNIPTNITSELNPSLNTIVDSLSTSSNRTIKIGVLDGGIPNTDELPNCTIGGVNGTYTNGHCAAVTNIIMQYAPDAIYYFAGIKGDGTPQTMYELTEWLLDQGVQIINMSRFANEEYTTDSNQIYINTYGNLTKWFDHIAHTHYVLIVKSSGNTMEYAPPYAGISSPGMAYNVITVGAMKQTSTAYTMVDSSSYYTGSTLASKPDISAIGAETSYSAPVVTGIAAHLLKIDSQLEYSPELLKAILTAAVNTNTSHHYSPTIRLQSSLSYMQAGAGLVDFYNALGVTLNNQSRCSSISPTQQASIITLNVTTDDVGSIFRVSMAYTIPVECVGTHTSGNITTATIPNLDLAIYAPNSTMPLVTSGTTFNNIEIVEFTPPVAGTYTIKVINTTPSTDNVYWGVAWHIFN